MIFHEIYGSYYNAVADIIKCAQEGGLTESRMSEIINKYAFEESALNIIPSIKEQKWQLICRDMTTPIKHTPSIPLTEIQKRWLKAVSLDPRFKLFGVGTEGLEDIEPLFLTDDYFVFDRYNDGDNFQDETYIKNFRIILRGLNEKRRIYISYSGKNGRVINTCIVPVKLEYSAKDDKFRLYTAGRREVSVLNLGKIISCSMADAFKKTYDIKNAVEKKSFVIEIEDKRNALERVMMHFAHFQKEAEKVGEGRFKMKVFYRKEDETELVIRVLSFGPQVKAVEPEGFVNLIKERLVMQKKCNIK